MKKKEIKAKNSEIMKFVEEAEDLLAQAKKIKNDSGSFTKDAIEKMDKAEKKVARAKDLLKELEEHMK